MKAFRTRAIKPWEQHAAKAERWVKGHLILSVLAVVLGLLTLKGIVGAAQMGNLFSVKQIFISAVGDTIKTDNYNHTNILLVGVGGEGHDGANLTDTMIVASINHKDNSVAMISIPRDFYVENEQVGWGTRLNSIYEYVLDDTEDPVRAMEELQGEVEKILNVDVHYYAKIDFKGFAEIIDALDGITVNVSEQIADYTYPAGVGSSSTFDPFYLSAGIQTLDGDTALKYVRSRHSTSDFDRARRQQDVLAAIKDRALSLGFLGSPSRIKNVIQAVSANFETNMSVTEMLSLADFGQNLDLIQTSVLNDEAYKMGGFLYTPPRDEGDPFYLRPYSENNEELQLFAQLFFYHPEIYQFPTSIQVVNGTKEESLAGLTKMMLTRYGFNVLNYGNAAKPGVEKTTIIPMTTQFQSTEEEKSYKSTMNLLQSLVFGEAVSEIPEEYQTINWPTDAKIIIVLGADFAEYYNEHDELFYIGVY